MQRRMYFVHLDCLELWMSKDTARRRWKKSNPFHVFIQKGFQRKGLPLEITASDFFVCLTRNMSRIGSLRRITETVGSIYGIFKTCLYLILSGGISVGLVAHKKQPRTTMPVDRIQIHARFEMCSTKLLSQFLTILFASSSADAHTIFGWTERICIFHIISNQFK